MSFPLPLDPTFRREIVEIWILDIKDRIKVNDFSGAAESWRIANEIYLMLPPGCGDEIIEKQLVEWRVKLYALQ